MIAELHIQAVMRGVTTIIKKGYSTQPFKVANITEDKKGLTLRIMLMNSSPGILDGDQYKIKIELQEGCSLDLRTQSYQRIFHMKNSASQQMEVYVGEGAAFSFISHPAVPHASSNFVGRNKIFLSAACTFIWGEVLACGRKLSGEIFLFTKYHNVTEVFIKGKLILKENLLLQPLLTDVNTIGQMEGYTHQATLIYLNENASVKALITGITAFLLLQSDIIFGITPANANGLVVRLLGHGAEQLFDCLKIISEHLTGNKVMPIIQF